MKKIMILIKVCAFAGLLGGLNSCSEEKVEVVTQDTSWQIDHKYIEEDIRELLGFDPHTDLLYFGYYNDPVVMLNAIYDTEHTTIQEGDELSFTVKVTKPLKEDVVIKLQKEDAALNNYPQNIEDVARVTEDNCIFEPATLKAGEVATSIKMKFDKLDDLTDLSGYVLAVRLAIEGNHENLKVAQIRSTFYVRMSMKIQFDNIDSSNAPIEGTFFNRELTFESDAKPDKLGSLNDGNLTNNQWWTGSDKPDSYLDIILPEITLLKGFKMITGKATSGSYMLKSCDVLVDNGNGAWLSNGIFDRTEMNKDVYVKFKKPVQCKRIRLAKFNSFANKTAIELTEVELIK